MRATRLLFTDQAEFYVVCEECYAQFKDMQWSGSTRSIGWRELAGSVLHKAVAAGNTCEFCGPGGNGGWAIDGKWPAAERRDRRGGGQG